MDEEDAVFKERYERYKLKVKLWEKDFRRRNGRIPSKLDIRDAHSSIRDAYRMYYKLKTSFLEQTLSEAFDDDGFDVTFDSNSQNETNSNLTSDFSSSFQSSSTNFHSLDSSQLSLTPTSQSSEFSNLNTINKIDLINLKNVTDQHVIREFAAEEECKINDENAWRSAEVVKPKENSAKVQPKKKLQKTMSDKLFRNLSFSTRNPRKMLPRTSSSPASSSNSSLLNHSSSKEVLPDLETILVQKSLQQKENQTEKPNLPAMSNFNVDQGWLNRRCSDGTATNTEAPPVKSTLSFGISNLAIDQMKLAAAATTSATSNSGIKEVYSKNIYDDDDDNEVIEKSDPDEPPLKTYRAVRHVLKKRKFFDVLHKKAENIIDSSAAKPTIANEIEKIYKNDATKEEIIEMAAATQPEAVKKSVENKKPKPAKKIVKKPNTAKPISRKSTRTTRKLPMQYTEQCESDEDPFKDDEHDDPEFKDPTEKELKINDEDVTLSPVLEDTKETKRKVRKPNGKPPKKVPTRKTKKIEINENDEQEEEEENAEYVVEFGTETVRNIPRMAIDKLNSNTEIFNNYLKTTGVAVAAPAPQTKISKPESAATAINNEKRKKLEDKIKSGKLNENFRRINIQKKVFVRGKKTLNFSKYKKQLWKKGKAAAALAGPEMDMRGCDGGFLVCFQCGQQGHFAQDCKIKADRLLPNLDDIEESSFLTLDEVAQMAKDRAPLVHGNKPEKLPTAANTLRLLNEGDEFFENCEEMSKDTIETNEGPSNLTDQDNPNKIIDQGPDEPQGATVEKKIFLGHKIPEEILLKTGYLDANVANSDSVEPLYSLTDNLENIPDEVYEVLKMFGHKSFRKGQDRAIMRILCGQSTLVTLSTGSGKSLCYQLPAYLYRQKRKCITLVISPLVSLMEDQVHDVPAFLNAQCLHTNQSKVVRQRTMDIIKSGVVDVLLISPEAVVAGEKSTGFGSLLRELPPIAFVCIDEAHCMSQWSHNFRPSYLMICRVLREKLKVKTILGLTATATLPTKQSIVDHMGIPDGLNGVISDIPLPNNLILSVSKDENREIALVRLLRDEKFINFHSIIIYCTRRDECERVAKYIRTAFQDMEQRQLESKNKRKRVNRIVEFYHAGMVASRRKTIQNDFMRGHLKIVVATIAFGMGINKSDIQAVIHYNMPMTFEGYVQEIGRAGRDGNTSHCHLFLERYGKDKFELKRHIFANSIDRHVIRKLLQKVFIPCACAQNIQQKEFQADIDFVQNMSWTDDIDDENVASDPKAPKARACLGHEVCFSVDSTVQLLDIPAENIETLLCYLELHEKRYIQVLSKAFCMCKVLSYAGPKSLKLAAQSCPPLAMAIALDLKKGLSHDTSTVIEFDVIDIAAAIGWDSGVVKYQLKNLEWTTVNGLPKRSTLSVDFYDLGFRIRAPGDLSDDELDATLDFLHKRSVIQEKTQLTQLQNVFNGLSSVALNSWHGSITDEIINERSEKLKLIIRQYFQNSEISQITPEDKEIEEQLDAVSDGELISDIRSMIASYRDNNFTGRSIARIFYGVPSPVYPAQIWSRCKYWRVHIKASFNRIVALANKEIVNMRS